MAHPPRALQAAARGEPPDASDVQPGLRRASREEFAPSRLTDFCTRLLKGVQLLRARRVSPRTGWSLPVRVASFARFLPQRAPDESAPMLPATLAFLGFILLARLAELALSRHNTVRLVAMGAYEVSAGHFPLILLLDLASFAALAVFGYDQPLLPAWLAIYAGVMVLKLWSIRALGSRWTARIIVMIEPLVTTGPYARFAHPSDILGALATLIAPLVLGLPLLSAALLVPVLVITAVRIRAENITLTRLRSLPSLKDQPRPGIARPKVEASNTPFSPRTIAEAAIANRRTSGPLV
jgi:methyltransferase